MVTLNYRWCCVFSLVSNDTIRKKFGSSHSSELGRICRKRSCKLHFTCFKKYLWTVISSWDISRNIFEPQVLFHMFQKIFMTSNCLYFYFLRFPTVSLNTNESLWSCVCCLLTFYFDNVLNTVKVVSGLTCYCFFTKHFVL